MNNKTIAALLAMVACLAVHSPCRAGEKKPNIIIVLADDMGWSDLGCYGSEIPTPNLDKLAAKGLRFRQVYNNAVCGPSRASLLTGLYCQQIGHSGKVWNHFTDFRRRVTIADLLKLAGYRTIMVGKWQEKMLPTCHGFDRFFGSVTYGIISYFNEVKTCPFYLGRERWHFPAKELYITDAMTEKAVGFVKEAAADKKPFFLYLAYVAPHWPLHAPAADMAPHRERYQKKGWDAWRAYRFERQRNEGMIPKEWTLAPRLDGVKDWKTDQFKDWQAERMAVYAAQVVSIDRGVGQLLETLEKSGVADDTLIMFLSDNGPAVEGGTVPSDDGFGFSAKTPKADWRLDGGLIRPGSGPKNMPGPPDTFAGYGPAWANVSATPYRNAKLTCYEGGIRTPLIAHWPAGIRRHGQWSNAVGHLMDLLPTCIDLAGVKYPVEFQGAKLVPVEGKSLVPIFRDGQGAGHDLLCWDVPQNQALRWQKWSLVNAGPKKAWELYDLDADATQTRNLAAQHSKLVEELTAKYQAWAKRCAAN